MNQKNVFSVSMEKEPIILLSTAYLPPIQYVSKFLLGKVLIENDENYIKQTWRNRCVITGPNGIQTLVVPVKRGSFHKIHIKDVEVDYDLPWVRNHLRTFNTAYKHSPFYEYYIEHLEQVYRKKIRFLLDLNSTLLDILLKLLDLPIFISYTGKYYRPGSDRNILDYRESIHPKKRIVDPFFQPEPYHQVFDDRYTFQPNLSIVDLLFNEGPESLPVLRRMLLHPA